MKQEKFWDKVSDKYDKTEKRLEIIFHKVLENTKKYLTAGDVVLDFGCGTGTMTVEIARHVKEIHAIDISSKMLEYAKQNVIERHIENVNFIQATLFDTPYEKESFDVILAFGILHLLKDNRQIIQKIGELLKPGGLLISSTPCLAEKMTLLTKFQFYPFLLLSKTGLINQYLKRFKITELDNLISAGNLQIIKHEKIFHRLTAYFVAAKK